MNKEERYERSLKRNEFVIAVDEFGVNSDYQERMFLENQVSGFLKMTITYKNEWKEYHYEISSMETLLEYGKQEVMSYLLLKDLLIQIKRCIEILDKYMLEEEKVLFSPQYIFLNKITNKMAMIFFPSKEEAIEDFTILTEYLITIINHEDELAIWAAYTLEKEAKMENFSFVAFLETMYAHEAELRMENEKLDSQNSEEGIEKNGIDKEESREAVKRVENEKYKIPMTTYIRKGLGFGLAAGYFIVGKIISDRYAYEYKRSMFLLVVLIAVTMLVIFWSLVDMIRERNREYSVD